MNNDIILKADNLYFSYDDEKSHSLNGLSLEIKRGQKIAFIDRKSTRLNSSHTS